MWNAGAAWPFKVNLAYYNGLEKLIKLIIDIPSSLQAEKRKDSSYVRDIEKIYSQTLIWLNKLFEHFYSNALILKIDIQPSNEENISLLSSYVTITLSADELALMLQYYYEE